MRLTTFYIFAPFLLATLLCTVAGAQVSSVTVTAPLSAIDVGQNVTVNATVIGGYGPYMCSWTWNPLGGSPTPFANSLCTVTFSGNSTDETSPDVVTATISNATNNDAGSGYTYIAVKPQLIFSISASANEIYAGNSVYITNVTSGGEAPYIAYYYIVPNGVIEQGNEFAFPNPGIYKITEGVEDSDDNYIYASVNVIVLGCQPSSRLSVSISAPSNTLLTGQSEEVSALGACGVPPYQYEWFVNGAESAYGPSSTLEFSSNTPGQYNIYAQITDQIGETSNSQTLAINVISPLTTTLHASQSFISAGQAILFTNSTGGGESPYTYSYTVNNSIGVVENGNNMITFDSPGNYLVTLNANDALGDAASSNVEITVTPALSVSLDANATTIDAGQSVLFSNSITGGTGSYGYAYTVSPSSNVVENGNKFTFGATGNYVVTLTVNDLSGETSSSSVLITVEPAPALGCKSGNNGPSVSIVGSGKTSSVQITDQSAVYITGSSDTVTINMPGSNCNIAVYVTGSSDKVNIYNGTITLTLTGSSNVAGLHNTVVSAQTITGSSDKVTGAILDGNSFTITGSSSLVESFTVEKLSSLTLTGSGENVTLDMLTSQPVSITITGSSNVLHITNGTISLRITGSSNYVYYDGTTITSQTITGSGNKIIKDPAILAELLCL